MPGEEVACGRLTSSTSGSEAALPLQGHRVGRYLL